MEGEEVGGEEALCSKGALQPPDPLHDLLGSKGRGPRQGQGRRGPIGESTGRERAREREGAGAVS
eukprot:2902918-Rhodomonas_salina.1